MNIQQAMIALREGKKIKRIWWDSKYYLTSTDTEHKFRILCSQDAPYEFGIDDLLAIDWVVCTELITIKLQIEWKVV